jgi:hypothetical protein
MMKKSILQNIFIGLVFVCLTASAGLAQTTAFTYQGKLSDAGNPANGAYDIQFKLFDALTDGTQQGATFTNPTVQVTGGIFTVELDFGATVFDGAARYLEICVRPAAKADPYTVLTPRQAITSTPYAMRSAAAGAADGLSVACVNCVTSSQIASVEGTQVTGVIPVESVPTGSGNYIQNAVAAARAGRPSVAQEGGFDLTGDGQLGGNLIVNGGVGIGKTPSPGIKLDVLGNVLMTQGNGGVMQFYTPNTETGMSTLVGAGRADMRFDGAMFKLVAGLIADGPPSAANGIAISTIGAVGIGTNNPSAKLDIAPGNGGAIRFGTPNIETGMSIQHVVGAGRADVRFDGTTLKLVTIAGGGVPGSANGIAINTSGNVGIGTLDPTAKLQVVGTARASVLEITGGLDLAEHFEIAEGGKPGLVVAINPHNSGQFSIARGAYNRRVAGIISGANQLSAGMVLSGGKQSKASMPIALSGRVWVYCDATRHGIRPGDLLTTSNTAGHAMKVINYTRAQGAVIGKAMTELKSGRGLVLVLVTLQ